MPAKDSLLEEAEARRLLAEQKQIEAQKGRGSNQIYSGTNPNEGTMPDFSQNDNNAPGSSGNKSRGGGS